MSGFPGSPNGALGDGSRPRPRRRIVLAVTAVVVIALVLAAGGVAVFGGSTTSSTPDTAAARAARQLLESALAAAGQVNSFHYVATSTASGAQGGSQTTVGDAGPTSGRQVISTGSQRFTVLVVGRSCYLMGNAAALVGQLGLSSSSATAHAGQWVSLAPSDGPYASVYAAVSAPSAISDNVTVTPRRELAVSRLDGRRVRTVTGTITPIRIAGQRIAPKGTATLAVRAASPHLPVRYSERGTQGSEKTASTVTFSGWGEPVNFTAPSGSVAYATLGAGSGSVPSIPSGTVLT